MKKTFLFTILTFLAAGLAFGGTITVTQPAGGSFAMGAACPVHWTITGTVGNIKIQLISPGGGLVGLLAGRLDSGSSPYNWTVASPAEADQTYRIRVSAIDGSASGESAEFSLTAAGGPGDPGTIGYVRLGGASPYTIGSSVAVTWTAGGVSQNLKLQLLNSGGGSVGVIVNSLAAGTTSYSWSAGQYIGGTAGAGEYKIRVSTIDGSLFADSAVFSLGAASPVAAYIHLVEPGTVSSWPAGSDQAIIWRKTGDQPRRVQITLRREGAPESEDPAARLADGVANNERWSGRIPASVAAGRYFVRVRASHTVRGDSVPFPVTVPGASSGTTIRVTSPLSADRWCIGQERTITWTKSGTMHGYVAISLRRIASGINDPDALTITTNTANDGIFNFWRIPASVDPDDYFIRVRTNERGSAHVSGESPIFTICPAGGGGSAPPTILADLELAGVGIEYAHGQIVAWIRNNGPEDVFRDVQFLLNFPERGGGGHYVTRRINVPAGQERSVDIQSLATADIPEGGLRTSLSIETSRSGIRDGNLRNQHRDVRLGIPDIKLTLPHGDFQLKKLYLQGGKDYHVTTWIIVRHNGPSTLHNIRVFWQIDTQGGAVSLNNGSYVIDSLAPEPQFSRLCIAQAFGKYGRPNADLPAMIPGEEYRFQAGIYDPDHVFNDPNAANDRDAITFSFPD
jgi:hypothetical protein